MTDAPTSLEWIKDLVAVDSTSHRTNLPIIELVETRLRKEGAQTAIRLNPTGDKANLIASFPAANGSLAGGLALSGHTDVVPALGQDWQSDPFTAEVRDGRIFGRGTADMKGFLGAALSMVPLIKESRLREPVHFVLSYDEEIGLHGGAQLTGDLAELGLTPRQCVVGEPTGMRAIGAHKSFTLALISVQGRNGHSSQAPNLVNPVFYGARMISFIEQIAEEFESNGPFDDTFDIPFSTISVNQVTSGNASNTVPSQCQIRLDLRTVPAVDPQQVVDRIRRHAQAIEGRLQARSPELAVAVKVVAQAPGLARTPQSELLSTLSDIGVAHGENVAYGTEAGFFDSVGIETVVCGPGDISQAHIADEYVALDQIAECERVLGALINTYREV